MGRGGKHGKVWALCAVEGCRFPWMECEGLKANRADGRADAPAVGKQDSSVLLGMTRRRAGEGKCEFEK